MDGPSHYRQAEIWVENAWQKGGPNGDAPIRTDSQRDAMLATAQVHATLALAAATATLDATEGPGGGSATGRDSEDARTWTHALYGGEAS